MSGQIALETLQGRHRELAEIIGLNAMTKLCEVYGGNQIYIPTLFSVRIAKRNAEILSMRRQGMKVARIAEAMELTPRAVQYVIKNGNGVPIEPTIQHYPCANCGTQAPCPNGCERLRRFEAARAEMGKGEQHGK